MQPGRLFGFAAFYTALFALTLALAVAITPWYYFALDAAILLVAALLSVGYIRDHVRFERRSPGDVRYYRLHPWVPIAYIVLFVTRIGVSLWVLGPSAFEFVASSTVSLSVFDQFLLQLVDALFGVSTGLLIARSVGVYLAYERERAKGAPGLASGSAGSP